MEENEFPYSSDLLWTFEITARKVGVDTTGYGEKLTDLEELGPSTETIEALERLVEDIKSEITKRGGSIPEEYDEEKAKEYRGEAERQELEWAMQRMLRAVGIVLSQDKLSPRIDFPNYPGVRENKMLTRYFEQGVEHDIERYRKAVNAWEKKLKSWGL